jgi:hypothetical protein
VLSLEEDDEVGRRKGLKKKPTPATPSTVEDITCRACKGGENEVLDPLLPSLPVPLLFPAFTNGITHRI